MVDNSEFNAETEAIRNRRLERERFWSDKDADAKIGCCALILVGYVIAFIVAFNVLRPIVTELFPGTSDPVVGFVTFVVTVIVFRLTKLF